MKNYFFTYFLTLCSIVALCSCLPEEHIKIYPVKGASNVPVNAMVAIYIKTSANVSTQDLKSDFFSITTCQKENATQTTTKEGDADADSTQKQDAINTPTSATKVEFYTQMIPYSNTPEQEEPETQEDFTTQERSQGVLVYLIPKAVANSDTPLTPGTTYCVSSKPFKNKQQQIIQGASTSFTTEDIPGFLYNALAEIEITQNQAASQNDYIVLNLGDAAVAPERLKQSLTLCQQDQTIDAQGPCQYYGKKVSFEMFMFENLIRADEQTYNTQQSNLFSITPMGLSSQAQEFRIILDTSLGATTSPTDEQITKTIRIDQDAHGAKTLTTMIEAEEKSYYQSFRIGTQSR